MSRLAKWRTISREEFEKIVKESSSFMEVGKKLGYTEKSSGGALVSIKKGIEFYNLDTSHFTGQGWNKDNYNYDWMKKGVSYHSSYSQSLIFLRGRRCECCGNTEWQGSPIPLEVHHIDGDKTNNEENNLKLLCPNCHALTPNYKGRKTGDWCNWQPRNT